MSKIIILGKIVLVVLFLGGLFLVTQYAETIRSIIASQMGTHQRQVAGARTSLEKEVKSDLAEYAQEAKEKTLQMKVSDLVAPILRVRKIGEDVQNMKDQVINQIDNLRK